MDRSPHTKGKAPVFATDGPSAKNRSRESPPPFIPAATDRPRQNVVFHEKVKINDDDDEYRVDLISIYKTYRWLLDPRPTLGDLNAEQINNMCLIFVWLHRFMYSRQWESKSATRQFIREHAKWHIVEVCPSSPAHLVPFASILALATSRHARVSNY